MNRDLDDKFFAEMRKFGMHPSETRVLLQIGSGLLPELREALRVSDIANDRDGLLMLTRLSSEH